MALTDKQRRFVDEYLIDLNATQAAIRAGYSERTASEQSSRLLGNVKVAAAIERAQAKRSERTQITADKVLQRWWDLANVDVNELVEYRRQNCRHCWGIEFGYQWTHGEYEKAQREAEAEGKESPSCDGGFGFDHHREPNAECPECGGEGRGKVHVHDTRRLKGAARALYAGVHQGKDGLKVLLEDRGKALENVARHLGMFNDKRDDDIKALNAERLRMENEQMRKGIDDPDDAPPESRKFVIEVRDARKRDDAEP
ncbi:terminase small subunit [Cupriavidus necator]|uniref:terminase small subunit n=1 Tax=Cupriavidus necator TaxID=106590 RepID=UPI00148F5DF3|nr:terminase small subunit [Cupriavidus necator]NOV25900.1 terminase small subunit [Cupriavidus necator]